jgi:D-alanyl-D-alanine-carboxypeptidase/D-alanyl-D-alanine-endopeptidase
MITRRAFALAAAASAAGVSRGSAAVSASEAPRVRGLLAEWVDARQKCLGVSAALVTQHEMLLESHGVLGLTDARAVTADTVFGIASLTKVFTGLLLSVSVLRGEVALGDPLRVHLPTDAKLPTFNGREITLLDLALHASGLPQEIPDYVAAAEHIGADPNKPLFDYLATHELAKPIGERWSYSNLNYALIGIALSHRTGLSFENLILQRIARPLGLRATRVVPTAAMAGNRAHPHLDTKTPAPEWNKPWSLGAGSLQSTARDLAIFVSHAMGQRKSRLTPAFNAMLETTRAAPFLAGDQAIGWGVDKSNGDARVFFGGRAPGFTSSMMFDQKAKRAAVVLGNSALMVESLGREILRPGSVTAERSAVAEAFAPLPALDRLVGRYGLVEAHADAHFAVGEIVEISRTATSIAVFMPRYPKVELKPLGDGAFGIEGFPVRYEFAAGEGPAASLSLTINGKAVQARRSD